MDDGATPLRALVVEDDEANRLLLTRYLTQEGFSVDTASDGAEALSKVDEQEPDAIILDVMMPVMNGWEFLELWRTRPAEHRAPVLVISAVGDERRAIDAGAQGYLSKPFDLDTLETALANLL